MRLKSWRSSLGCKIKSGSSTDTSVHTAEQHTDARAAHPDAQGFPATHRHVSKDLWPRARNREARQRQAIGAALSAGESVVIDNVNASKADRAPLIAIAQSHRARVVGYFFAVTTPHAVARNAERTGRARVPNVAICDAAKRLEAPTRKEGFDRVFRVELTRDQGFDVRPA